MAAVLGQKKTVSTRKGDVEYREGGIGGLFGKPGALAGTVISPGPINEATAIHEQMGHNEGKGAGHDWMEYLKGYRPAQYGNKMFTEPSEIYAHTTQPAELSYDDMVNYANLMKANPEFVQHFEKYKNPETDWNIDDRDKFKPKSVSPVAGNSAFEEFLRQQKLRMIQNGQ